jgi:hypothetical protein
MAANVIGTTGWRFEPGQDSRGRSQNTLQLPDGTRCAE